MTNFASRYGALAHALQSGVKAAQEAKIDVDDFKHLRVGVNMAMIERAAIVQLLLQKGIITQEEYETALLEWLEKEVAGYEALLSRHYGANITLG